MSFLLPIVLGSMGIGFTTMALERFGWIKINPKALLSFGTGAHAPITQGVHLTKSKELLCKCMEKMLLFGYTQRTPSYSVGYNAIEIVFVCPAVADSKEREFCTDCAKLTSVLTDDDRAVLERLSPSVSLGNIAHLQYKISTLFYLYKEQSPSLIDSVEPERTTFWWTLTEAGHLNQCQSSIFRPNVHKLVNGVNKTLVDFAQEQYDISESNVQFSYNAYHKYFCGLAMGAHEQLDLSGGF